MPIQQVIKRAYRGGAVTHSSGNRERSFDDLYKDVISVGLCTLCGMCAGSCPKHSITMFIDDYESGDAWPRLTGECKPCGVCTQVCPGKTVPLRDLGEYICGREADWEKEPVGVVRKCVRAQAISDYVRNSSSTGGIGSILLAYALHAGIIDAAIVAGRDHDHPWRARPILATTPEQVYNGVRSDMTMIPNPALLNEAVFHLKYKRIGLITLPCQAQGLRKLQLYGKPRGLAESVKLVITLFCALTRPFRIQEHFMKEYGGFSSFDNIASLDYRAGPYPGAFTVTTKEGRIFRIGDKATGYGGYYNVGRERCKVCIDFSGELADLALGDVFQLANSNDPRWTATLARTEMGEQILERAARDGWIRIEEHDVNQIPASGGGWEAHYHANLVYLRNHKKWGWPVPDYQRDLSEVLMPRKLFSMTSKGE